MEALSAATAIEVWEAGRGRHTVDRALALLAAATSEARDDLAALSIGQRDERLLRLRQATFGDRLPALAGCPACDERLEVDLACGTLLEDGVTEAVRAHHLEHDGYAVTFRLPNSFDLAAAAMAHDVAAAREMLLSRCVLAVRPATTSLPDDLAGAVAEAMSALDPHAEVLLDLACPHCAHEWQSTLDIAALLWTEVSAYARRLLLDVDQLARAYGWSEPEILALSAARRATYLELVAS